MWNIKSFSNIDLNLSRLEIEFLTQQTSFALESSQFATPLVKQTYRSEQLPVMDFKNYETVLFMN